MKKTYLTPSVMVQILEPETMLEGSQFHTTSFSIVDGDVSSDANDRDDYDDEDLW